MEILRTLLIFGIVLLHVPPALMASDIGHDPFNLFKYGVSRGLFRATVPVLTCISGYLLFCDAARFDYRRTVAGKARRILFPFLLWNVPLAALLYLIQRAGLLGHDFRLELVPFDLKVFADAALALTNAPVNYPLDFLRDLFVIFLLSPIFLWLIRKAPWIGLLAVAAIFLNDWDGLLILRSTMPVCFYVGGMAAVYHWKLDRMDRLWPLALSALIAASAVIALRGIENVEWFRLLSPPLVWVAAAPLTGSAVGNWLKRRGSDSFFLFLSHGPVLLATYIAYQMMGEPFPYPLYWIGAPILVCATILTINRGLKQAMPRFAAFLVGDFARIGVLRDKDGLAGISAPVDRPGAVKGVFLDNRKGEA
ncbi:acyltransferase family protein [Croceicoccus estronivorus]|uniref:acyltransferase family protein n=1 Tax=Croceicoccus estronivorus TaxID=1172626 RepID=UPI0014781ED0|nr:acyltransferase [Croceicoccus estronivorus]